MSGLSVCTVDTWKIRLGSEDRFLKNCAALIVVVTNECLEAAHAD